jgi:type I restriction enzyme S subunit
MGFLYAFLATPFGVHQLCKDIYGGVVDHINPAHIEQVVCPNPQPVKQKAVGDLVRQAFELKDAANDLEDKAIRLVESVICPS